MRAETSLMAARKFSGFLSYRVAMARNVFELVEEALDQISVAIQKGAEDKRTLAVALGRDIGPDVLLLGLIANGTAVVCLVRQQGRAWLQVRKKLLGCGAVLGAVMGLARFQSNPDRRPSASTRAWILVVRPPRERPMPPSLPPFFPSRHAGGREHRSCRS